LWHPPAKAGSRHRGTRHRRVRPLPFRSASARSLGQGRQRVIYLILGPDRLLAREAVLARAADIDPSGSNTIWFDGREITISGVASAVGAASFFDSPRVVIVTDLLARTGRESDSGESTGRLEDRGGRGRAEIEALVSAVPESHHLLLFEPTLTSVPAILKSAAPALKVIASEPPRGSGLIAWIQSTAVEAESRIDRGPAQRLAETLYPQTWDRKASNPRYDRPPDLARLKAEIEKLALAAHPEPITIDHIGLLTSTVPDQRVFRFLDAALMGDLRAGLDELERLIAGGEEPAMLLAQLLGQLELATVAAAAGGKNADAVGRDLGAVATGRISSVMATTRRLGPRTVGPAGAGAVADRNLKTGRIRKPEDALRDLVLALATNAADRSRVGSV
jgi:DNA polymerase III delta subunit